MCTRDTNVLKSPLCSHGLIIAITPPEKREVVQPDFFGPELHTFRFSSGLWKCANPCQSPLHTSHPRVLGLWKPLPSGFAQLERKKQKELLRRALATHLLVQV